MIFPELFCYTNLIFFFYFFFAGKVSKIGSDYMALLLYNCFNVSISKKINYVKLGDKVKFKIKFLNFSEKKNPFIQGELINVLSNNTFKKEVTEEEDDELTLENKNGIIPNESSSEEERIPLDTPIKSKSSSKKSILNSPNTGLSEESPNSKSPKIRFHQESSNVNSDSIEEKNDSTRHKKSKKKLFPKFNTTLECNETFKEEENNDNLFQDFQNLNINIGKKRGHHVDENLKVRKSHKKMKISENLEIESNNNKINAPKSDDTLKKSNSSENSPKKKVKLIGEFCSNLNNKLNTSGNINESNDIVPGRASATGRVAGGG